MQQESGFRHKPTPDGSLTGHSAPLRMFSGDIAVRLESIHDFGIATGGSAMKRLTAIFVTWLAVGLLAGCVPNAASYYGPSVAGGQVVTSGHCVPERGAFAFDAGHFDAAVMGLYNMLCYCQPHPRAASGP